MKFSVRKIVMIVIAILVVGSVVYGFLPKPIDVELAKVVKGDMSVTVDQEGKTRVKERYIIASPLAGRLMRIEWEPGDVVYPEMKQPLIVLHPDLPSLIDDRARTEADMRVLRADNAVKQAEKQAKKTQAQHELAKTKLQRARTAGSGLSAGEIDELVANVQTTQHDVQAAEFALKIAEYEHKLAESAFVRVYAKKDKSYNKDGKNANFGAFAIPSPIHGTVLKLHQESAKAVTPGTDLLEIGDLADLEAVIDVLSTDAVKIKKGAPVEMDYGAPKPAKGKVRLVEPFGFTKISALGVEEQRVNVIVTIDNPPAILGDGYRVESRIFIWEGNVVKVPSGALFRDGSGWAVFVVRNGTAHLQKIDVGHNNGLEAEIRDGLQAGEHVIVHPGDQIKDGAWVNGR